MPFDAADPRSGLATEPEPDAARTGAHGFGRPQVIRFADHPPETTAGGSRSWRVRTQHFVVVYTDAMVGDSISSQGDDFERLVIVPDTGTQVHVTTADGDAAIAGPAIVVVPAGTSTVLAPNGGTIVSVCTSADPDVAGGSINADYYSDAVPPHVADFAPEIPRTGLRCYALADYPADPARFGHIFRSQNLMVNFVPTRDGPRDISKLSPHSHPDFEQCSVQLEGRFVHHMRTPWTPDGRTWRDDEHLDMDSPGMVIFPPPIVHTSRAVGAGANRLLDVFAPPRRDFLSKPGWVLNADEYPDGTPSDSSL